MGMYAGYYLLKQEDLDKATNDFDSFDFEEYSEMAELALDLDKSWDAIHYILTGKSNYETSELDDKATLINHAIFGSKCLNEHEFQEDMEDFVEPIMYVDNKEVADIAKLLSSIDFSEKINDFDFNLLVEKEVYAFDEPIDSDKELADIKNYLLENCENLNAFYQKASQQNSAVHVHIG